MKHGYFYTQELVPPEIFEVYEESSIRWINPKSLESLNALRCFLNKPIHVNTYLWDHDVETSCKYSGLRIQLKSVDQYSGTRFARLSEHYFGNAFDAKVIGMDAQEVRGIIVAKRDIFPHITRIEKRVEWLHFDCKETGEEEIVLFNP